MVESKTNFLLFSLLKKLEKDLLLNNLFEHFINTYFQATYTMTYEYNIYLILLILIFIDTVFNIRIHFWFQFHVYIFSLSHLLLYEIIIYITHRCK